MIAVDIALKHISASKCNFGTERVPLQKALGRVLKEALFTDRCLPPYDRVMMDGIGIQFNQFTNGKRRFKIQDVAAAGMPQKALHKMEDCLEVMTGSVCPKDIDAVVRYEDVHIENGFATVVVDEVKLNQNIHFKGTDREKGALVARENSIISAAEIGAAASIGKSNLLVSKQPTVIVISTGDELVEVDEVPEDHQIRRSNVYAIQAVLQEVGISADTSHLNDDKVELKEKLQKFLTGYDVMILSGGVSKGKFDFLPGVLAELGVEKLFHRVAQRPGKPFWFGKTQHCTVFALPGNPISSFLCAQRYFKYWYDKSIFNEEPQQYFAELTEDVLFRPDLTYFLEVKLEYISEGVVLASPCRGNGSGDLANLSRAHGFIELPQGRNEYKKGEVFPILKYRG